MIENVSPVPSSQQDQKTHKYVLLRLATHLQETEISKTALLSSILLSVLLLVRLRPGSNCQYYNGLGWAWRGWICSNNISSLQPLLTTGLPIVGTGQIFPNPGTLGRVKITQEREGIKTKNSLFF